MLYPGSVQIPGRKTRHSGHQWHPRHLRVRRSRQDGISRLSHTLYAQPAQITSWAYNAARDTEYAPTTPPTWGKPYRKQWWEDGAIGLREKLIDEADATSAGFSGLVVAIAPALAGEQQNDAVAKTVLTNAPPSWSSNGLIANNASGSGLVNTAGSIVKGGLAAAGVITASALFQ